MGYRRPGVVRENRVWTVVALAYSTINTVSSGLARIKLCGDRVGSIHSQLMFVLCLRQAQVQSRPRVLCTLTRLPSRKALWMHSRITPKSRISSFESSLPEEQIRARRVSCRGCATPRTVQSSTGSFHGELAVGYVLVPSRTFVLII